MVNTAEESPATDLVARLPAHRPLAPAPPLDLFGPAALGTRRRFQAGEMIVSKGEPVTEMIVILTGRIGVHVERGTGHRHLFESNGGDVGGVLPYSRVTTSFVDIIVEEPLEGLAIHRDHFPEMTRECPAVTAAVVHVMIDRARDFVATDWQAEKMVSLGRLAAGMAHELNNPASATARSAKLLTETLTELEDASVALGALGLTEAQLSRVTALRTASLIPATTGVFSAIERADHEDEIAGWLAAHNADTSPATALAESGMTPEHLDELVETITGPALDVALRWVAATHTARLLSRDIERAGGRIYDLVSSVKRFTYMDRATVTEPMNVAQGLADAVAVLAGKAKEKQVAVKLDVEAELPLVPAFAAELNQVWSNLLENALDAAGPSGHVIVSAAREGPHVVVRIVDDGAGIPADVQSRIFDPFFTTKPVGEGSGLGLDIARRIVRQHHGQIVVDSRPGRTEFSVSIPVQPAL